MVSKLHLSFVSLNNFTCLWCGMWHTEDDSAFWSVSLILSHCLTSIRDSSLRVQSVQVVSDWFSHFHYQEKLLLGVSTLPLLKGLNMWLFFFIAWENIREGRSCQIQLREKLLVHFILQSSGDTDIVAVSLILPFLKILPCLKMGNYQNAVID